MAAEGDDRGAGASESTRWLRKGVIVGRARGECGVSESRRWLVVRQRLRPWPAQRARAEGTRVGRVWGERGDKKRLMVPKVAAIVSLTCVTCHCRGMHKG
eukprot:366082-Chlamydomonas_euryale.AAC.36